MKFMLINFMELFGRINRFERPVTFKVQGRNICLGVIGGIVSLGMVLVIAGYAGLLVQRLLEKNDIEINQNILRTDLINNSEKIKITKEDGIEFRIDLYTLPILTEVSVTESAKIFSLRVVKEDTDDGSYFSTEIPTVECHDSFNQYIDQGTPLRHWCFKIDDVELEGRSYFQDTATSIKVELQTCMGMTSSICQNSTLKSQAISLFRAELFVKSKYADLNDINSPVKEYVDRVQTAYLHSEVHPTTQIYIDRHELTLEDSTFMSFEDSNPIKFNKVAERENIRVGVQYLAGLSNSPLSSFTVDIELGSDIYQYKRKLFTFLELTGIIGGVFEVFEVSIGLIFGIFYYYFSKRALVNEIKKNMMKIQQTQDELKKMKQEDRRKCYLCKEEVKGDEESQLLKNIKEKDEEEEGGSEDEKFMSNTQRFKELLKSYKSPQSPPLNTLKVASIPPDSLSPTPPSLSSTSVYDQFNKEKDCLDILFRIKKLEVKVSHLIKDSKEEIGDQSNSSLEELIRPKKESEWIKMDILQKPKGLNQPESKSLLRPYTSPAPSNSLSKITPVAPPPESPKIRNRPNHVISYKTKTKIFS